MNTYTYQLIPGGYQVYMNGVLYFDQPFDPEKPFINGEGQPFDSEEAARAHAEALIEALVASEQEALGAA